MGAAKTKDPRWVFCIYCRNIDKTCVKSSHSNRQQHCERLFSALAATCQTRSRISAAASRSAQPARGLPETPGCAFGPSAAARNRETSP